MMVKWSLPVRCRLFMAQWRRSWKVKSHSLVSCTARFTYRKLCEIPKRWLNQQKNRKNQGFGKRWRRKMNQLNFESPCINNCKLNEITNVCEGCGRTIKEIMQWTFMTDEERKEIMKRVGGRTLWKHYYLYVLLL